MLDMQQKLHCCEKLQKKAINSAAVGELRSSWLSSARGMIPHRWGNVPKGQMGKASFKNGGQAVPLNRGIDEMKLKSKKSKQMLFAILET